MSEVGAVASHGPFYTKSRYLWHLSAWRLRREKACAQYARQIVPPIVDGFRVVFPETEVVSNFRVTVRSRCIPGRSLIDLLYQPETRDLAVDAGMAALEALHVADITANPFAFFGLAYRLYTGPVILCQDIFRGSPLMSWAERRKLTRLVRSYLIAPERHRVLVHGDLQLSHIIVDAMTCTLGMIDLEALHIGKPAANFGQLWTGYHYADPALGRALYVRFRNRFPDLFDSRFDDDLRTAIALRSYRHVFEGRRRGNAELEYKARRLFSSVLAGASFSDLYLERECV